MAQSGPAFTSIENTGLPPWEPGLIEESTHTIIFTCVDAFHNKKLNHHFKSSNKIVAFLRTEFGLKHELRFIGFVGTSFIGRIDFMFLAHHEDASHPERLANKKRIEMGIRLYDDILVEEVLTAKSCPLYPPEFTAVYPYRSMPTLAEGVASARAFLASRPPCSCCGKPVEACAAVKPPK